MVIGGGAAGFFCAVNAARMNPSLEVTIVEKSNRLLSKVRISGGGRCNVTHACYAIPEMVKQYPRGSNFVKKTFHEFFTQDTISWFRERGVSLKAEEDGRMFPVTDSSETIIECLLREANRYGVRIDMKKEVKKISTAGNNTFHNKWVMEFSDGEKRTSDFLCVACGGYPKSAMFDWILSTGHSIEPPVPSLFTFNMPQNDITGLMGISVSARVKIQGTKLEEEGPVMITHWGLSGPAVLKLSAKGSRDLYKLNYRFVVTVNWCTDYHEQSLNQKFLEFRNETPAQKIFRRNPIGIPQRLWEYLCSLSGLDESMRWADLPAAIRNRMVKNICGLELKVEGKTTYKEEFVTAGGIRLSEIVHSTMESRLLPGLYFAGEILDVDGVTGGFNFQHAWTSAWIAAKSIASAAFRKA